MNNEPTKEEKKNMKAYREERSQLITKIGNKYQIDEYPAIEKRPSVINDMSGKPMIVYVDIPVTKFAVKRPPEPKPETKKEEIKPKK